MHSGNSSPDSPDSPDPPDPAETESRTAGRRLGTSRSNQEDVSIHKQTPSKYVHIYIYIYIDMYDSMATWAEPPVRHRLWRMRGGG